MKLFRAGKVFEIFFTSSHTDAKTPSPSLANDSCIGCDHVNFSPEERIFYISMPAHPTRIAQKVNDLLG